MTAPSRRLAAFAPLIGAGVAGSLYIILNILVSTALDIATIPTAVLDAANELFFWGNIVVQVAALIVGVMAGIERRRFTKRAGGTTSTDTPGTPAPHTSAYALGKVALILSAALPFMLIGLWGLFAFSEKQYCDVNGWRACQQSVAGLALVLLMAMFAPGAALLTYTTYSLGRDLLEPERLHRRPVRRVSGYTVVFLVAALFAAWTDQNRLAFFLVFVYVCVRAAPRFTKRRRS